MHQDIESFRNQRQFKMFADRKDPRDSEILGNESVSVREVRWQLDCRHDLVSRCALSCYGRRQGAVVNSYQCANVIGISTASECIELQARENQSVAAIAFQIKAAYRYIQRRGTYDLGNQRELPIVRKTPSPSRTFLDIGKIPDAADVEHVWPVVVGDDAVHVEVRQGLDEVGTAVGVDVEADGLGPGVVGANGIALGEPLVHLGLQGVIAGVHGVFPEAQCAVSRIHPVAGGISFEFPRRRCKTNAIAGEAVEALGPDDLPAGSPDIIVPQAAIRRESIPARRRAYASALRQSCRWRSMSIASSWSRAERPKR